MDSFCEANADCVLIITSRTIIVVSLLLTGIVFNCVILKICYHNKTIAGRTYMILMAMLDLYGTIVMVPLEPLWEYSLLPNLVFRPHVLVQKMSYLFVQLAMVFDRLFAVFTPFSYQKKRQLSNKILLGISIFTQVYSQVFLLGGDLIPSRILVNFSTVTIVGNFVVVFAIISLAYPAIVIKLLRQTRRVRHHHKPGGGLKLKSLRHDDKSGRHDVIDGSNVGAAGNDGLKRNASSLNVSINDPNKNDGRTSSNVAETDNPKLSKDFSGNDGQSKTSFRNDNQSKNVPRAGGAAKDIPKATDTGNNVPKTDRHRRVNDNNVPRSAIAVRNSHNAPLSKAASKKHGKVLKMFGAVLFLFVLTNASSLLG